MGPIEITGFEELQRLDRPLRALDDHELLERQSSAAGGHERAHRLVAHGKHPGPRSHRLHDGGVRLGQSASGAQQLGAKEAHGQVGVAQPEPGRPAGTLERRHHLPRVAAYAVTALVDRVGQPVGHEVGIRRHVDPVDLHVVGGVSHDRQVVRHIEQAAGQLGAAGPAGEQRYQSVSGRPVSLTPAWLL